jgi:putative membrane protein
MTICFLFLGSVAALPAVYANDSEHHSTKNTASNSGTMSTSGFVKEAAQGGMAEVELGRLAVERAQDPDIKQFAQRMIDDHGRANDELKQLAQRKKWKLPTGMSSKQQMTYNMLHDKAGADFDREYAKVMAEDHDRDVKMFEAYSEHGKDADLKSFAASTLPTLRDHQQMARANASKLGVSVASSATDHDTTVRNTAAQK